MLQYPEKRFCPYVEFVQYVGTASFCFHSKSKLLKHHSNSLTATLSYLQTEDRLHFEHKHKLFVFLRWCQLLNDGHHVHE